MNPRPFWLHRLELAWRDAPIVWLCGVRRVGKTTLARSLSEDRVCYLNCDLPSVEDMVRDPQVFFRSCDKPVVVFDEIHQLHDSSPPVPRRWRRARSSETHSPAASGLFT
jgi:predicted AAA+ superfamily ATPase